MSDNTSPVATLAARLPKGNGLTRAAGDLHAQKGALVPFIGYLQVEEVGEDMNDVLKVKTTIQRLELCFGDLHRDAKDLIARAAYQANSHGGQGQLFAEPGSLAAQEEDRQRYLGFLKEWQAESDLSDADVGEQWTNFHDGSYGPSITEANPAYLLEFLKTVGALPDEDTSSVPAVEFSSAGDPNDDDTAGTE